MRILTGGLLALSLLGCKPAVQGDANKEPPRSPVASASEGASAPASAVPKPAQPGAALSSEAKGIDPAEIVECAREVSTVIRLACYDALAVSEGLAPRAETVERPAVGAWRVRKDVDPLTDNPIYFATLFADTGKGRYGGPITLTVRCKNSLTELYVGWGSYLGSDDTEVVYRIDKEKPIRADWSNSTDNKATFFPGSPVATLKRLVDSTSFVASVTPYNENPITATFDTSGAKEALADLRSGCGW